MFIVVAESAYDFNYNCSCAMSCQCSNTEKIATFDTEEQAKNYIEKSKLKAPNRYQRRFFKRRSLLSSSKDAWVEHVDELPHNPDL